MSDLSQKLEALLFLSGSPMTAKRLGAFFKLNEEKIEKGLDELEEKLVNRGIRLSKKDGEYMLVTAPEEGKLLEDFAKDEIGQDLSRAMLETLAVIVYKGPISRSEIDYIRAVNSGFTLRNLMIRGLVERIPNPKDSRVWLYRPTFNFLKFAGIEKLGSLPGYEEFRKEMDTLLKSENKPDQASVKPKTTEEKNS